MAITVTRTAQLPAPTGGTANTGTATGDLTPGKTYYYRVAAYKSTASQGVPCAEFSAAADSNGSIDLSWNSVTGATAYIAWRTPTSGDWEIVYRTPSTQSINLNRDEVMLKLNNGNTPYGSAGIKTTTATTLSDIGTTTERNSVHSYYQAGHNLHLDEYGKGSILVHGGTSGDEASFDDVYADAVANGYTDYFKEIYNLGGRRIYVCRDDMDIRDYFKDDSFDITFFGDMKFQYATDAQIGKFRDTDMTYRPCKFTIFNPCGRLINGNISFYNASFYGVEIDRDFGNCIEADGSGVIANGQHYMNGNIDISSSTLKNCKLSNSYHQSVFLRDLVNFEDVDVMRQLRGLLFTSTFDSNSTFKNVRLYNSLYNTTASGSNQTVIFRNSKFYTTIYVHKFYVLTNNIRKLIDCEFPNGHNLPASASGYNDDGTNFIYLMWSFDLKIIDKNGEPINGANVKITDGQDNIVNVTTNASGEITTQELFEATYNWTGSPIGTAIFNTTVDYKTHIFEITATGYEPHTMTEDIITTRAFTIKLAPAYNVDVASGNIVKKIGDGKVMTI